MGSSNAYTSGVSPFAPGDQLSASALEKMREADQRSLPQRSLGTFVRQTPSGTMITPWRQPRRGTGTHPFKVIDATDKDGVKVEVIYGAVIDMMDWHDPKVIPPMIGGGDNVPDTEGRRPKLDLSQSDELDVFVVIHQGENGRVDDSSANRPEIVAYAIGSMPEIENGTLYVHVARIKTTENDAEGEEIPSRRIERIDQILGSHIVWPFKPDFVGWQHKQNDNSKSALWIGAGSKYIERCDELADLHIRVQREEFDNGRDGNTVFELSMPEEADKQSVLSLDKNQERGFEVGSNASSSWLRLDRKSTVGGGFAADSNNNEARIGVTGPNEGGSVRLVARENDARICADAENASIEAKADQEARVNLNSPSPEVSLSGSNGSTRVTTVDGKEIIMREISFRSSDGKSMKAWFLASEPEEEQTDSNDHEGHNGGSHHAEHHTEHGFHHMGHYVDPDHDPDDSGLGHGVHHAGHHQGHHAEHHDDNSPHHAGHHNQSGT